MLYVQYTAFMIAVSAETAANTFRYRLQVKGKKTPLQWWRTDGAEWPDLQKIDIKLIIMVISSAASERNLSTMAFIHEKLRNLLFPKTVEKLVFIKTNLQTFYDYDYAVPDEYDRSSDSEGDVSVGNERAADIYEELVVGA
jgi:hAT family C-terminal dimerisation region